MGRFLLVAVCVSSFLLAYLSGPLGAAVVLAALLAIVVAGRFIDYPEDQS